MSSFAFLFSEIIKYSIHNEKQVREVERRLADMGFSIGSRLIEYINWKEKSTKRETKLLKILFFITTTVWKSIFGHESTLEKSSEKQYIISEPEIIVSKFISTPKSHPNSNAFVAGIVEGILDSAEFPAKVNAPTSQKSDKAIILIEFSQEVVDRSN